MPLKARDHAAAARRALRPAIRPAGRAASRPGSRLRADLLGRAPPARRREDDGPITRDIDADVVIVGSGFTGLATALFLAREHGIKATVLEANRSVWGCTSRNGGQGQNASGRLYRSQWIARWGKATALRLDAEIRSGFETFKGLVAEFPNASRSPAAISTSRTGRRRCPSCATRRR